MNQSTISRQGISKTQAILTILTIKNKTWLEIICFLIVLLFIYTAMSKLIDYETFRHQLSQSPFITAFSNEVAWSIPTGEILIALALLFKPARMVGLYGSLFLMSLFSFYIYFMLTFSYDVPCSCGGVLAEMSWAQHLWFNIFFVAISIWGIFIQHSIRSTNKP